MPSISNSLSKLLKINNGLRVLAAGLFIVGSGLNASALAEQVKIFTGPPPAASELANMMFPERQAGAHKPAFRTRAIVLNDSTPSRPAPTQRPEGFGFLINFAYNSAEVLPESRPYLDQVGEMLNLEQVAEQKIIIEGHTDASGSAAYNQRLSEKRARAVKTYLVQNFQINPDRLKTAGKGENELLPDRNPRDATNRRVQFHRAYN